MKDTEENKTEVKRIIVIKKGSVDKRNRDLLNKSGYIVIESDDPSSVKIGDSVMGKISGNMICAAALEALEQGTDATCRNAFGTILREKMRRQSIF